MPSSLRHALLCFVCAHLLRARFELYTFGVAGDVHIVVVLYSFGGCKPVVQPVFIVRR